MFRRSQIAAWASSLTVLLTPATWGQEQTAPQLSRPVLVELFTSEGCSSCPPADRLLANVADTAVQHGHPVVVLSFHVDYWNNLGWQDPFSSQTATRRQQQYAQAFDSRRIYTPQAVVNGQLQFVGSDRRKMAAAIQQAGQDSSEATLQLTAQRYDDRIEVRWEAAGRQEDDAVLVALVQNQASRDVNAGENQGRRLRHVNVVRDLAILAPGRNESTLDLQIPEDAMQQPLHIVGWLQSADDASISTVTDSQLQ